MTDVRGSWFVVRCRSMVAVERTAPSIWDEIVARLDKIRANVSEFRFY